MACTSCHSSCSTDATSSAQTIDPRWRKALWIALAVNASMFFVELIAGLQANSVSLLADAVDFAGDAANYALSLAVLSMALVWRSRAALVKGVTMFAYGVFVLARAGWMLHAGSVPEPLTMGVVGFIALLANAGVIERFSARLNPKALGYDLTVIVEVKAENERAHLLDDPRLQQIRLIRADELRRNGHEEQDGLGVQGDDRVVVIDGCAQAAARARAVVARRGRTGVARRPGRRRAGRHLRRAVS